MSLSAGASPGLGRPGQAGLGQGSLGLGGEEAAGVRGSLRQQAARRAGPEEAGADKPLQPQPGRPAPHGALLALPVRCLPFGLPKCPPGPTGWGSRNEKDTEGRKMGPLHEFSRTN